MLLTPLSPVYPFSVGICTGDRKPGGGGGGNGVNVQQRRANTNRIITNPSMEIK